MMSYYLGNLNQKQQILFQWYRGGLCHRPDGTSDSYDSYEYNDYAITLYSILQKNKILQFKADLI